VEAALYVGRGVRSIPIAKGENSGDEDLEVIVVKGAPLGKTGPSSASMLISRTIWG
jgi:hypothetical protein